MNVQETYEDIMNLCIEPMDVDRSASSTSKMEISFNDTASDIYALDDDDSSCKFDKEMITLKTEFPELGMEDSFSTFNNISLQIKREQPEFPHRQNAQNVSSEVSSQHVIRNTSDDTKIRPQSTIKTYHIKMEHIKKKEPTSRRTYFTICGLMLLLSIFTYQVINFKCSEEMDLQYLSKSLTENLFGQCAAANKIIQALNMKDRSKIIFLYGGTGVGKTYAASLILEKLWDSANVYHYTMPTFAETFYPELMLGLTICKTSILVVDDLIRNDLSISSHITNVIAKSEKLGKTITIILVYNCDLVTDNFVKKCDDSFQRELEQSFEDINAEKYYVKFESLTQEHLKKCVEKELGYRKVGVQEMDSILKNFDVFLDGCKGVYTKIKFLYVD